MKLNTKMRYGTRALLELGLHAEEGPVSLTEIAASQELSEKYLESLFGILRGAGLVRSQRGAQGGYVLARPAEQITLREVFDALEGPEAYVPCTLDHSTCHRWATCVTQEVWAQMHAASMLVLESTTLADLVARQHARCATSASYSI
jgi:Rrf2 family transcriptional regulator, cysteine metabolism repressor